MWPLLIGAAAIAAYFYVNSSSGANESAIAVLSRKPKVGEVVTLSLKKSSEKEPLEDWGSALVKVLEVGGQDKKTALGEGKIAMGGILDGPHKGLYVLIVYAEDDARPTWTMARPADVRLTPAEKAIVKVTGARDEFMVSAPGSTLAEVGREKNIADSALITAEPAGTEYRIVRVLNNPAKIDLRPGDPVVLYSRGADDSWVEELPPV